MSKRERHQMALSPGDRSWATRPVISYRHGYLWIGNDAPGDMRCYGTLDEARTLRLAKAIVRLAARPGARRTRTP